MADSYVLGERLQRRGGLDIYRATRSSDGRHVILEILASKSPRDLERLKNEYEVARTVHTAGVMEPLALETYEGLPALAVDDVGDEPLERLLDAGEPMPVERFLSIAERVAAAVAEIHAAGVTHKNLNPENIFVAPSTGQVRITNFGIATRLPREYIGPRSARLIEGSLPYISPEQTGRTSRPIDSRSDLYSLGVTFYRMLTGRLPFDAEDPLEWVHCHIARRPLPPTDHVPTLPITVANIVLELLAKLPEERYQTAAALQHDLERCLSSWRALQQVPPFALGERDSSARFLIRHKLYGRGGERAALLSTFERVVDTERPALMLVSGSPGIGKSTLVEELQRAIVRQRGFFVTGKFDLRKRETPHLPFVQVFRELMLEILSESEDRIADWKRRLAVALGRSAQVIVDMIPELELVLGPQQPVPKLPPNEAENRLFLLVRQFLAVFAQKQHPLTIFFDDMQWADPASLRLLSYVIADPDTRYLMLIGAYRDDEVSSTHQLCVTVDQIRAAGVFVHELTLKPLSIAHVGQLIGDAAHGRAENVAPLARLVHAKTGGNPFFVIQFLTVLEQQRFIAFDHGWRWDLKKIEAQRFSDNVVELLAGKLRLLPRATQDLLKIAACLGRVIDASTLPWFFEGDSKTTELSLRTALDEELLLRLEGAYRFPHDRMQEAAYSLIPEAERATMHLRIGRILAAGVQQDRLAERVFEIVDQLNLGGSLIVEQAERDRVAELNLLAGERARASTAFVSATRYLAAGAALLDAEAWTRRHDLIFSIELRRAECEYLSGSMDEAEQRLTNLSQRTVGPVEAAAVAGVKISLHMTQSRPDTSVEDCLELMRLIGIDLAPHPTREQVEQAFDEVWKEIGERQIEDLGDVPFTTDHIWRRALNVMLAALGPASATDANLFGLISAQMVLIGLRHGHSEASTTAYEALGSAIGSLFNDYRKAFQFGRLGVDIMERRELTAIQPFTYFGFGTGVNFWTHHIRTNHGLMQRVFDTAVELGNLNLACYSFDTHLTEMMFEGVSLELIHREAEKGMDFARRAHFTLATDLMVGTSRLVQSLRGLTTALGSFYDAHFDEESFEQHLDEGRASLAMAGYWYFVRKLQSRYLAGQYAQALVAARRAEELSWTSAAFLEAVEHRFYESLALAARYDQVGPVEQARSIDALAVHRNQLAIWAEACPENFANRHALVCAEIARIEGDAEQASELYEQAIRSARDNGFVHNRAVANEVASRFHRDRGAGPIADTHLREARACYLRWGALGKVSQIDRLHPELDEALPLDRSATVVVRSDQLDLQSIVRACHRISSESDREQLVRTLMEVVLEQGGARTARVIMIRREELTMGADATRDETGIRVRLVGAEALSSSLGVPLSILQYVRRTKTRVLLDDARADAAKFAGDEYLLRTQPRSLLCLPILRQTEVVGLLYLENDLVAGAFTSNRITALELIASQAAISLDKALLLDREHSARLEAEAARAHAELLDEASALLSSVVEYPSILAELTRFCVRSLADWAVIDLVEDGKLRRAASSHKDPELDPLLRMMEERYAGRQASMPLVLTVLESGTSLFLPYVEYEEIRAGTLDEEHADMVRRLGTGSVMVVPLVARGVQLGALALAARTPGRYRTRDLELVEELARRAALAIDNARLVQAEARSVERLARVALAVRDITNTSLQTLVTSLDLLNGDPPSPTLDRMRRAINRIRQLDAVLSAYGENVRWRGGDEGFDPVAVIENARDGDGDDRK